LRKEIFIFPLFVVLSCNSEEPIINPDESQQPLDQQEEQQINPDDFEGILTSGIWATQVIVNGEKASDYCWIFDFFSPEGGFEQDAKEYYSEIEYEFFDDGTLIIRRNLQYFNRPWDGEEWDLSWEMSKAFERNWKITGNNISTDWESNLIPRMLLKEGAIEVLSTEKIVIKNVNHIEKYTNNTDNMNISVNGISLFMTDITIDLELSLIN
jgi:hypothetical protein